MTASAQQDEMTATLAITESIDGVGNGHVHGVFSFNPARVYDLVKKLYPNLYVLFRDLGPERFTGEVKAGSLKIFADDAERKIKFSADAFGEAVCRNNRWQVSLTPGEQLSDQDGNRVSTVLSPSGKGSYRFLGIGSYVLPANAQRVKFDREAHLITYFLPPARSPISPPPPQLEVHVRYKERLMSALYKIYSDNATHDGEYWVAKTIVKNDGGAPIYDLKIYYRLGEYTETSVPEAYSIVVPGGAAVDAYYPLISSKVAQLKTRTPVDLSIRYEYKDGTGRLYSGRTSKRLEILGINGFDFSNLNDQDRSDLWFDDFNNAPLLAAFVTRLDDPVKQFAGYVSQAAGGVPASDNPKDAIAWLRAAYNMELQNDIVYSTPSELLEKGHSMQDIKYPRDVFRDKTGTCVDLAITLAALAASVGLHANIMVKPNHAFPVIRLPDGSFLPIESTGLGGGNQRATFEQAVELGKKALKESLDDGRYILINLDEEWGAQRIPNPELPALPTDFLRMSGIRRLSELNGGSAKRTSSYGTSSSEFTDPTDNEPAEKPGSRFRVVHDHGLMTLKYYCVGSLYISTDKVAYVARRSNDSRRDRFEVLKSEITEARESRWPLAGKYAGLHIRLQNGRSYNFMVLDSSGYPTDPDEVLNELTH